MGNRNTCPVLKSRSRSLIEEVTKMVLKKVPEQKGPKKGPCKKRSKHGP